MSYLGVPRLHFSGMYQADPSTVNNDPEHFDMATFQANYDEPGQGATNGWWNPQGSGAWRFRDCTVRSVVKADGTYCDDPGTDPVVGSPINAAIARVAGKLVDLDPEQQMVSQIWGFQIVLGVGGKDGFSSDFDVAPFGDIWVRFPKGQPDSFFSATYQSVLTSLAWSAGLTSPFLKALGNPDLLSIKFTVDGYDDDSASPTFTFGRVSGAIGPYVAGEPRHIVPGRRLRPLSTSPLNFALARMEGNQLYVDLANSMPTSAAGGPMADLGNLGLVLLPENADPVPLGPLDYRRTGWYEDRAGIQTFPLTPEQAQTATIARIAITDPNGTVLAEEDKEGSWLQAEEFVFRLDPGVPASTTLYAYRFGQPAADQRVTLVMDNSSMQGQVTQGPIPGPPVGVPPDALTFPASLTTAADGTASVELQSSSPGNPRGYIDGQVYGVRYDWAGLDLSKYQSESTNVLSVHAFDAYSPGGTPTWLDDVQPIFHQYAELYPVMRRVLDLGSYQSCLANLDSLQYVFGLPPSNPNYMPVVRDLSSAKRSMIQAWLMEPRYMRVDTVEDLKAALQHAIELEHATIPAYLTSLFSIKAGRNRRAAEIIRGVVVEEMLHMALACNLLSSIGGSPRFDRPGFVPDYPGGLPGGLRPGLIVTLRKASIDHIRDVFMSIEEPSETVDPVEKHHLTIGWFYDTIRRGFQTLAQSGHLFDHSGPQLTSWRGPGQIVVVRNLPDAERAIDEIVTQGEGASPTDPDDPEHELAHYFRFEEIVEGRELVVTPGGGYAFTGAPVPFDPDGVWPMVDDPDTAALEEGSLVRHLSEQFDEMYTTLLGMLEQAFTTDPDTLLGPAIEMMFSLEVAAKGLMQTPIDASTPATAGPAFQYRTGLVPEMAPPQPDPAARFKPLTMKGQPATRTRGR